MTTNATTAAALDSPAGSGSAHEPRRSWRIGWVVGASLAAGLVAALLLAASPVVVARETEVGGAVLVGFAVGWLLLRALSVRFTDQPQRWAVAPGAVMGGSGAVLVLGGSAGGGVLGWVLPGVFVAMAVWMVVQARRHLRSRARRWLLYPVVAVMAVGAAGAGYETFSEATDVDVSMPGQLIDVGGHRLHLHCTGSGSPTVVLQAGGGQMSSDMGWIAPAVAQETRVCVYDRAGRGWSDPVTTRQDAAQIAADLHTMLRLGHVPGPYVLAGHSFGGLYALTSAARYPDEVAGMVLIDSTQPETDPALRDALVMPEADDSYSLSARVSALTATMARLGVGRLFTMSGSTLPVHSAMEVNAGVTRASNLRTTINEYVAAGRSAEQAAAMQDFGDKPLVVLTAGIGSDDSWVAGHERLASFSTNSVHRVVDGADHSAMVSERVHAAVAVQAILDVVASVRAGEPLIR